MSDEETRLKQLMGDLLFTIKEYSDKRERSVHLNLISRINTLELNSSELGSRLQVAQGKIEELEAAMREIYEVYAGSEGFIPETCAEGYQQQLIKEMSDIAAKYMRKGLDK